MTKGYCIVHNSSLEFVIVTRVGIRVEEQKDFYLQGGCPVTAYRKTRSLGDFVLV